MERVRHAGVLGGRGAAAAHERPHHAQRARGRHRRARQRDAVDGLGARRRPRASAIFNPIKILRELWLDRAILLGLVFFVSFNIFSYLHVFIGASPWWFVIGVVLLLPAFIFYARSVESDVGQTLRQAFVLAPQSARITQVKRVIQGHVHLARHTFHEGIEYLNTGTWSPAYRDVECTQPYGRKCFAWVRPAPGGEGREAELYEWVDGRAERLPVDGAPIGVGQKSIMESQA